jgi:hypothetical protein
MRLEIGQFLRPDKLWLLATGILKSSTNLYTLGALVTPKNDLGKSDKVNDLHDIHPPGPADSAVLNGSET